MSTDPQFIDKVRDVVGLYLNPPDAAVVLCVDEKTQVQALDRTAPVLPMLPGTPARQTYTYVRNGTSDLYAALDVASGKVITQMTDQHRAVEFRAFLNLIDRTVPDELAVHVICDNASTHKAPEIERWLKRHRRFTLHYTPTYSSWLNQVERWFSELTTKKLRRATHRSVAELRRDINDWVEHWNNNPRPFIWRKTADEILDNLAHISNESTTHDTSRRPRPSTVIPTPGRAPRGRRPRCRRRRCRLGAMTAASAAHVSGPTRPSTSRPWVVLERAHRRVGGRPEVAVDLDGRDPTATSEPCSASTARPLSQRRRRVPVVRLDSCGARRCGRPGVVGRGGQSP